MSADLTLQRLHPREFNRMNGLAVAPEQQRFVGTIDELKASSRDTWHFHLIEKESEPIGFFNLDLGYADQYDFAGATELGLRAFFIDVRHQGFGYGKVAASLLKPYVRQQHPGYSALVLTVNCKNAGAYRVYQHSGFEDEGDLYHGGAAGPQHVMRLRLTD